MPDNQMELVHVEGDGPTVDMPRMGWKTSLRGEPTLTFSDATINAMELLAEALDENGFVSAEFSYRGPNAS